MRRSTVVAVALAMVAGLFAAAPASADHPTSAVTPTFVEGNPTCEDLLGDDFDTDIRIDPPVDGTFPFSNSISGTVMLEVNDQEETIAFSVDGGVALAVIVKGGPNANLYDYRPDGVASDQDLHAPINPNNDQPFGLSHVDFCLGPPGPPPPPPPPPPDGDDDDDDVEPAPAVRVEPSVTG